jgi:hypothetical protein
MPLDRRCAVTIACTCVYVAASIADASARMRRHRGADVVALKVSCTMAR